MREQEVLLKHERIVRRWSGLRGRTTLSYILVTVAAALVAESLVVGIVFVLLTHFASAGETQLTRAQVVARWYALAATVQANGTTLDPHSTFQGGQAASIAVPPGVTSPIVANDPLNFALLIDRGGHVVASTYTARYSVASAVVQVLPGQSALVARSLAGKSAYPGINAITQGHVAEVVETVWTKDRQPMGAVYVQASLDLPGAHLFSSLLWGWLASTLLFLVITIPLGGFFGTLTTRSLVRRVQRLALATTRFASGNDEVRVAVMRTDEVGQLEAYFNQMAEQLVESSAQQRLLQEQNGRLAERARITRELHDAISQSLFSLRMLAGGLQASIPMDSPLMPQIMILQQTTATMIREMRALLLELRPAQLEHLGLAEAIEDLAAAYRARLGITVTTALTTVALPTAVEHAFLRIAQEALANAARHADATVITLELASQDNSITFIITDNGAGFTVATKNHQHGLGLHSMQERIQELHGTLTIETSPGQGTRIHICLPHELAPMLSEEEGAR